MLAIRYQRQGRKNSAFFRVVLTESSRPVKSGFLKILGWYNPHTKETSLNKEEIQKWLALGAIASNSVSKLLSSNDIKHKNAEYTPDTPKAKKSKGEEKPQTQKAEKSDDTEAEIKEENASEAPQEEANGEEASDKQIDEPAAPAEKTEEKSEEQN